MAEHKEQCTNKQVTTTEYKRNSRGKSITVTYVGGMPVGRLEIVLAGIYAKKVKNGTLFKNT